MEKNQNKLNETSGNLIILGIVLSILTYWLFAQTFLNLGNTLNETYDTTEGIINLSISLTSLITGVFMVAAGKLSDRFGQFKMALLGVSLSIVGSLLIIITANPYLLLSGRIIQGFSAAMLMLSTISILNNIFEGEKRRSALSYWSMGAFGGTGLASIIGGVVSTYFAWQWIFVISILFAAIGLVLMLKLRKVNIPEPPHPGRFDTVGLIIFTIFMAAISIFITQGNSFGWTSTISIVLLITAIIGAITFYIFEKKQKNPFIDLTIFENKSYLGVATGNFLLNMGVGAIAVFNLFVQDVYHLSPFQSGLLTLPYVIFTILLVKIGEKRIEKYGAKKALVIGPIFVAFGLLLIGLTIIKGVPYFISACIGFAFFGAGVGLFATPALDTAVSSLSKDKTGVASAIFKMTSTLGAGFGIAILVTVYTLFKSMMNVSNATAGTMVLNIIFVLTASIFIKVFLPKHIQKAEKLNQ
ncbi:MFS transporter [Macrococcus animalis]|uniref:MFS transporter n=1 Tax=Macrococcus animalis TaxID=3395467 RepID=UPI0039BEA1ED